MPRSTFSAVRTPGSDRPSSTSVIATAGCMPDHHRPRVEDARHAGDVGDHPADERVDDLERPRCRSARRGRRCWRSRRSGRPAASGASRSCMSTWMVTSRKSPILRIGMRSMRRLGLARAAGRAGHRRGRVRFSASAKASASVALVVTSPRSTPRCTMVWAICGRMPLMMQSAPIRRAAVTVLSRCCADQRIDRRHAGDVDDRDLGAGLDDALQQRLHHDLRARAVERADQRQGQDAVPQLHHRRRELEHLLLLPQNDLFPVFGTPR